MTCGCDGFAQSCDVLGQALFNDLSCPIGQLPMSNGSHVEHPVKCTLSNALDFSTLPL